MSKDSDIAVKDTGPYLCATGGPDINAAMAGVHLNVHTDLVEDGDLEQLREVLNAGVDELIDEIERRRGEA